MFDFILAAIIAQATPAAEASPAPPASAPASEMPTVAPPSGVMTFPRGPRRMPLEVSSLAPDDVLIRNSGSTNTAGYAIVVHKDGTADFQGQHKTLGAPQLKWLYAKLDQATPFAELGSGHCMKSASFGSFTTIQYRGESTGDLSCPGGEQSRELMRTIGVIVDQLGISTRRTPGMLRM